MTGLSSTGATAASNNRPRELTSFDRREREIAQVCELLDNWEAGEIWNRLGDAEGVATCLEGLASILAQRSQSGPATRLPGSAETLRASSGSPPVREPDAGHDETIAAVRLELDAAMLAAAWEAGRSMSADAALAYAERVSQ